MIATNFDEDAARRSQKAQARPAMNAPFARNVFQQQPASSFDSQRPKPFAASQSPASSMSSQSSQTGASGVNSLFGRKPLNSSSSSDRQVHDAPVDMDVPAFLRKKES